MGYVRSEHNPNDLRSLPEVVDVLGRQSEDEALLELGASLGIITTVQSGSYATGHEKMLDPYVLFVDKLGKAGTPTVWSEHANIHHFWLDEGLKLHEEALASTSAQANEVLAQYPGGVVAVNRSGYAFGDITRVQPTERSKAQFAEQLKIRELGVYSGSILMYQMGADNQLMCDVSRIPGLQDIVGDNG
jgi:hypothetical protein